MTEARYREKNQPGYEDVDLDLDPETVEYLERLAVERDCTVDEVVEDLIARAIEALAGGET